MKPFGYVLGYHGCSRDLALEVVNGRKTLRPSTSGWDWLGSGMYFWESNLDRALAWKPTYHQNPEAEPFAIGAIIAYGNCLDLLDLKCLELVRDAYEGLAESFQLAGQELPVNAPGSQLDRYSSKRLLDCAVLNYVHEWANIQQLPPFDTVRGAFLEGTELYPGAMIMDQTHIQICVRDPGMILGWFIPPPLMPLLAA